MNRKAFPWLLFFVLLSLLVFSRSTFARVADYLLWPIRFGILVGFSALLVCSRFRHRNDGSPGSGNSSSDSVDRFLSSMIRWYHGESNRQK